MTYKLLYHLPQPTPLHKAAMKGNLEIVKYLVDHGANVNSIDHNGVCLFCMCVCYNCTYGKLMMSFVHVSWSISKGVKSVSLFC